MFSVPSRYDLPDQCRLDMTENDIKTGKELLQEAFIMKNPKWMKELQIMVRLINHTLDAIRSIKLHSHNFYVNYSQVKTKQKAEIQALSSFGFQYITEVYLPRKLKEGDWI